MDDEAEMGFIQESETSDVVHSPLRITLYKKPELCHSLKILPSTGVDFELGDVLEKGGRLDFEVLTHKFEGVLMVATAASF